MIQTLTINKHYDNRLTFFGFTGFPNVSDIIMNIATVTDVNDNALISTVDRLTVSECKHEIILGEENCAVIRLQDGNDGRYCSHFNQALTEQLKALTMKRAKQNLKKMKA
jgi:hypothetical protein